MPSYKVHLLGGTVTYFLTTLLLSRYVSWFSYNPLHHIFFILFSLLGSIFPDIDITSRMQIIFFRCMILALPSALLINKILFFTLGCICFFVVLIKHRTITHHIWFLILFPLLTALYLEKQYPESRKEIISICTYFSVGALSHRLLDFGPRRFFSQK